MTHAAARPTVLVLAGVDPSGGAGIAADILAVTAQGAHALPVVTTLTVQDNNRVYQVLPVAPHMLRDQANALIERVGIDAVKIGIPGSAANAAVIAELIVALRRRAPALPVVLDPVLASGLGDALARGDARAALAPLLALATLLVPNLPEAAILGGAGDDVGDGPAGQARALRAAGCAHVLITGGHADGAMVVNQWFGPDGRRDWSWPRLPGQFHGSGCTLASAIAARLALGEPIATALERGQAYCQRSLAESYAIAPGQRIPHRFHLV
ncbi:MAG: hydroxymethylpyrimidine/phosphomethylpyrimidine kinase [Pseudomonadota bacterium]